ncbi:MAG: DUF2442 domain-containing protein [Cyanobacteria bacterium WB6_1B_304]|nr:DUF2442 domain-containing protein [Cyanobacteria bacterium WB6_1B_304]
MAIATLFNVSSGKDKRIKKGETDHVHSDGRTLSVPLAWYPRLMNASVEERNDWRFIASGEGIHWT